MLHQPAQVEELRERIATAFAVPEAQRAEMGRQARSTMLPLTWEAHLADWMRVIEGLPSR